MDENIKKAIGGDKNAFTSIVLEYEQQLYKIARTRLADDHDICDAIQNTLLSAYQNVTKVRKSKYFKTWLIRILLNECNAVYRKKQWGSASFEEIGAERCLGTEDGFSHVEHQIDFNSAMQILNFEERQAMTLFYTEDLSIKEISKLMNLNVNTVKTRLSRAKGKLKKVLKEEN